jgi:hypothetical protein
MREIYVQIPAYRDEELSATLLDLYRKAAWRQKLRVGVVWQRGAGETLDPRVGRLPRLELHEFEADNSPGCNWARRLLQDRWSGEPYTLLIDSHHRFVKDWDRTLVEMYEARRMDGIERPLITAYLPAYVPAREPRGRMRKPLKIYPLGRQEGVLTKLTSYPMVSWRRLQAPVLANFVSLHFLFTAGRFNADVPFDPSIYFFGDEVATGLRAFTWGYELLHPHRVLGWHAYDRASRVPHWDDHGDWHRRHRESLRRLRWLFSGDGAEVGLLGCEHSVEDYEARIMLDLVDDG